MSGPRVDGTLPMPPAPEAVPELAALEGVLALPGPAGPGRFLVEAGVVRVTGRERGDVDAVTIEGRPVVSSLFASAGAVANVVATPSTVRRERLGPLGTVQETTLAVESQRGAVMQWKSTAARRGTLTVRFTMDVGGDGGEVRYRLAAYALVLRPGSESDDRVVLVHPPPAAWTVVEAEGGGLVVEVETALGGSDGTVTLAVASSTKKGRGGLEWLAHIDAHHRGGQRPPWHRGGVRTATGVAELDDGMGWLAARIASSQANAAASAEGLLWWGLGALACGLENAALRALEALEAGDARWTHTALLAARIASTTGDQGPATRVAARLLSSSAARAAPDLLADVAGAALADALRYAAPQRDIEALRAWGAPQAATARKVALPMAGAPPLPAHHPSWLTALMEEAGARDPATDPLGAAIATLRGLGRDDLDAYGAWRDHVAGGLSHGPVGRGTWEPAGGEGAPVAGALACALVHGVLGWEPDAPVGRITLRPSFPRHLGGFSVHGLAVGDTRISLGYAKEGPHHTYTFEPTEGRVPATLVFEPRVVAAAITELHLDGQEVELCVKKTRDRIGPSVQIPLDGPRSLRLTTGEG